MKSRAEYKRKYRQEHKEERQKCERIYYQEHKEHIQALQRRYYANRSVEEKRERYQIQAGRGRERRRQYKIEVLTHYGQGKLACPICGEDRLPTLTIDHLNDAGNEHRKALGGRNLYIWLKEQDYPDGYMTLCMNCQFVKREQHYLKLKGELTDGS